VSNRWLPDLPWGRRAKGSTLALTIGDASVRYVFASDSSEFGATINSWGAELRGSQTREAFLARVKGLLPAADRTLVLLDTLDYQMLQLEAPNVPAEELKAAIRWRAMESLEGTPDDYTMDLLSVAAGPGRLAEVLVAVARNEVVRARMLECEQLGRSAKVIDVTETAHRNLLHAVLLAESDDPPVAAALIAFAGRALMVVSVQGQLCFSRRFEFDVDTLAVAEDDIRSALVSSSAGEESAERSMVQLHRSLDLWDISYPNLPLATMRVDAGPKTPAVLDRLKPETGVDTRPLALSTIFNLPTAKKSPPWHDPSYLPLLGALLRPAKASA